jgi:hypothetical protein
MADNIPLATGPDSVATDDIGGVHWQKMKLFDGTVDSLKMLNVLEDQASATGDPGFVLRAVRKAAPANTSGTDGDYEALQVSNGLLWVTTKGLQDSAGTDMTNTTLHALNAVVMNVTAVSGNVAHDGVDTPQNPVLVGHQAIAHGTTPTAVGAADMTRTYANREGLPWMIGGAPNVISREITVLDADGAQTNASLVGTIAAGTKLVVTRCGAVCDADNSVSVAVRIGFGAAAVPTAALAGVNGVILSHPDIPAGSGYTVGNGAGIIGTGGDGEELRLTCDDPVGGSLVISVSYYTTAS